MSNRSGRIGTATAEAVAQHLGKNGWPSAERRVLHGNRDRGDIVGTPGLAWEVKGGASGEASAPTDLLIWQSETLAECLHAQADIGVLVTKRKGVGLSRPGLFWAWLCLPQLLGPSAPYIWVRTTLDEALVWLQSLGYPRAEQ